MSHLVVFDTNVFVSYLFPTKKISPIKIAVNQISMGDAIPVYSSPIMAEYERVLHYKKFKFSEKNIHALLELVLKNGLYVVPRPIAVPFGDISDKPFYDAARAAGAWLVTGNTRHFPAEGFIVSPREYLERIGD